MQIYILNENAKKSSDILILKSNRRYYFKMLTELMQLLSTVMHKNNIKNEYLMKNLKGKAQEFQKFIIDESEYVYQYGCYLYNECYNTINMKKNTIIKYSSILNEFYLNFYNKSNTEPDILKLDKIPFRYYSGYIDTDLENKMFYDKNIVIEEYNKYLDWKMS